MFSALVFLEMMRRRLDKCRQAVEKHDATVERKAQQVAERNKELAAQLEELKRSQRRAPFQGDSSAGESSADK